MNKTKSGRGPIQLVVTASRSSGTAPLYVFFDASTSGATPTTTTRPFHEIEYTWDFGDPSSGTWTYGARPGVNSKNAHRGPMAGHVFETAGTYTVTCTARYGTNTISKTLTVTVASTDSAYPTTATVCVSTSGDFTGAPTGCVQVTASDWASAYSTHIVTNGARRLLFRAGETFSAAGARIVLETDGVHIGSYGTGAQPILTPPAGEAADSSYFVLGAGLNGGAHTGLTITGLNFDASSRPLDYLNVFTGIGSFDRWTVLRCTFGFLRQPVVLSDDQLDGWKTISQRPAGWSPAANPAYANHHIWDEHCFAENVIDNAADPGVATTSRYPYGWYGAAERSAFMGNFIDLTDSGDHGSHVIRLNYSYKVVINNNDLRSPGADRLCIKMDNITYQAPRNDGNYNWNPAPPLYKMAGDPANNGGGMTRWVHVSDNYFLGSNNTSASQTMVEFAPGANDGDARGRDVIFERNWGVSGPKTAAILGVAWIDVTIRNNLFNVSAGPAKLGIRVTRKWQTTDANKPTISPLTGPVPTNIHIYNNTFYSSAVDNDFQCVWFAEANTTAKGVILKNNLGYAPNDTLRQMISQTPADAVYATNSTDGTVGTTAIGDDPLFTSATPSSPADFAIQAGSYGKNTGSAVPVWTDFFGNLRSTSAPSYGFSE